MNNDLELRDSPTDGISAVKFSNSVSNLLASSSWDKSVRIYNVDKNEMINSYECDAPVLDVCLIGKETCFSGGLDGILVDYRLEKDVKSQIYEHEDAIKSVVYSPEIQRVFTGSWDKTIKAVDPRATNANPSAYEMPEKVYSMSLSKFTLVVALSQRKIFVYDVRNMSMPTKRESALKYQTRYVACFPNAEGYAVCSIEGRVCIEYFDSSAEIQAKKYAFKCHRQNVDGVDVVYPVHALAYHPRFGTFCSGGGDRVVNVWDGENKKRLRQYPKYPTSISSLSFNTLGSHLAIASSYCYEEGEKSHPKDSIFIKSVSESEFKPKSNVYENRGDFVETSLDSFDLIPLIVLHHGAGLTAHSFAMVVKALRFIFGNKIVIMAYDCRGHGKTFTTNEHDFSLNTLSNDLQRILHTLYLDNSKIKYDLILVGHSLGGAVVVDSAINLIKDKIHVLGVVVLDVVEGTALESLKHMHNMIRNRPSMFNNEEEAVSWSLTNGTIRNSESAKVSVPSQLMASDSGKFTWRTDLSATEPYWNEWFSALSEKFLAVKAAKLLILAGTDRLDKLLTIGQIQGKFQMVIIPNVGHLLHEDDPSRTAEILHEFWKRNSKMFLPEPLRKKLTGNK